MNRAFPSSIPHMHGAQCIFHAINNCRTWPIKETFMNTIQINYIITDARIGVTRKEHSTKCGDGTFAEAIVWHDIGRVCNLQQACYTVCRPIGYESTFERT